MHNYDMKEYIVVTGAGKGIGRATASNLCALGHSVIAVSRTAKDLEELEEQVNGNKGNDLMTIQCDVSEYTDFFQKVQEISNEGIKIRALIMCAGWGEWYSASNTPMEEWHGMINSNLTGVFNTFKVFYDRFMVAENFQVIAISSDSAYMPYGNRAAYCSSKAGLSMFIDCLREDLREKKYRVTEIVPSRVDTHFRKKIPGSRKGGLETKDIADIIEWLLTVNSNVEIRKIDVSSINSTFGR